MATAPMEKGSTIATLRVPSTVDTSSPGGLDQTIARSDETMSPPRATRTRRSDRSTSAVAPPTSSQPACMTIQAVSRLRMPGSCLTATRVSGMAGSNTCGRRLTAAIAAHAARSVRSATGSVVSSARKSGSRRRVRPRLGTRVALTASMVVGTTTPGVAVRVTFEESGEPGRAGPS